MNAWSGSGKVWLLAIEGQCLLCARLSNEEGQSAPRQVDSPVCNGQAIEAHSDDSWNNESESPNAVSQTLDSSNINLIPNSMQAPNQLGAVQRDGQGAGMDTLGRAGEFGGTMRSAGPSRQGW